MRRIAVLSGLVLVGGLLGPSTAFADGKDGNHNNGKDQWIAVQDHFVVVLPDGQTFSGDAGPMNPNDPPAVGAELFISEKLFSTKDGHTRGAEVGRSHIQCTAQAVDFQFLCDAAFVFDPNNQLLLSAEADFGPNAGNGQFRIAVTGGTGNWFGATGDVSITDMSTSPNESVSLYQADVEHPHD
jgi:hypothetical protein